MSSKIGVPEFDNSTRIKVVGYKFTSGKIRMSIFAGSGYVTKYCTYLHGCRAYPINHMLLSFSEN